MQENLRISGKIEESIVDGKGIRYVIFTQGCPHHCPECHNPQTHDFNCGTEANIEDLFQEICENPLLKGVTFSGGEPFCQPAPLAKLADLVHQKKLDVTTYTGFTLEQLLEKNDSDINALLQRTDVLIDGRFEPEQKDLTLLFRGSRNQRIINVKKIYLYK